MSPLLIIFIIVAFLVMLGFGIWLTIIILGREEEEMLKGAFVFNIMARYCNNSYRLIEKNVRKGRGGRWIVDVLRLDIDPDLIIQQKPIRMVIGRDKREMIVSEDGKSKVAIYYPPRISDIPEQMKNTFWGRVAMQKINETNLNVEEKELLESQVDTQGDLLKKTKGMGLVRTFIAQLDEINKDWRKLFIEKDDKKSSFSPLERNKT